jgi:hypothetical protein
MAWAAAFFAAAVGLALLADLTNLDKDPAFDPKSVPGGGIAIFAGFAAASAVLERMLELASPFIPWWRAPRAVSTSPMPSGCRSRGGATSS